MLYPSGVSIFYREKVRSHARSSLQHPAWPEVVREYDVSTGGCHLEPYEHPTTRVIYNVSIAMRQWQRILERVCCLARLDSLLEGSAGVPGNGSNHLPITTCAFVKVKHANTPRCMGMTTAAWRFPRPGGHKVTSFEISAASSEHTR